MPLRALVLLATLIGLAATPLAAQPVPDLSWSPPNSGGAPTGYTLIARLAAGAPPVVTLPLGPVTPFGATAPNGTFAISLAATNASGTGPESPGVSVTFPGGAPPPPAAPTGVGVSVAGSTATFVAFPGVPSGTYYLRLTATNAAGTSPPSNEVAVTVP
jgi:hypothetical protein